MNRKWISKEEAKKLFPSSKDEILFDENHVVKPNTENEIKFHGTLEELKKYLPELYNKLSIDNNDENKIN